MRGSPHGVQQFGAVPGARRGTRRLGLTSPESALMRYLGFEEHVRGSHHLFDREGIVEIVNLQSQGGHAKPYQVRQIRRLILKYKLGAD